MLTFFLIIIFIVVLFIIITYYRTKLEEEKSNLIFLSRHHSTSNMKNTNIRIEYFFPKSKYALSAINCEIHIAPLNDSNVISKISVNTSLAILDCALINDEVWYEVEYPSLRRINNKGWIKNTDINISKLMMSK